MGNSPRRQPIIKIQLKLNVSGRCATLSNFTSGTLTKTSDEPLKQHPQAEAKTWASFRVEPREPINTASYWSHPDLRVLYRDRQYPPGVTCMRDCISSLPRVRLIFHKWLTFSFMVKLITISRAVDTFLDNPAEETIPLECGAGEEQSLHSFLVPGWRFRNNMPRSEILMGQ